MINVEILTKRVIFHKHTLSFEDEREAVERGRKIFNTGAGVEAVTVRRGEKILAVFEKENVLLE